MYITYTVWIQVSLKFQGKSFLYIFSKYLSIYDFYKIMVFMLFNNNMNGVTSGAGTAYPSGAPKFMHNFQWG